LEIGWFEDEDFTHSKKRRYFFVKKYISLGLTLVLSFSLIGCNTISSTPVSQNKADTHTQSVDNDNAQTQSKTNDQSAITEDYSSVVEAFLKQKNLRTTANSQAAVLDIQLPTDFNAVKNDIKVGELLKRRNELSGHNNLDFSKYMGQIVKMFTTEIDGEPKSNYDIVLFIAKNKVVGYWVDAGKKDPKQSLPDFNVLVNLQIDPQVVTFLEKMKLDPVVNSGHDLDIGLPSDFNAIKDGVNIGELLKQRNSLSKQNNLDFSKHMGGKVKMYAYTINTGDPKSNYDIVLFIAKNKVVGYWVDAGIKNPKQNLSDYNVLAKLQI